MNSWSSWSSWSHGPNLTTRRASLKLWTSSSSPSSSAKGTSVPTSTTHGPTTLHWWSLTSTTHIWSTTTIASSGTSKVLIRRTIKVLIWSLASLPSLLILHSCVLTSIKLLHPILPFLTEELFQRLPTLPKERRRESVMVEAYPQPIQWNGFLNPNLGNTVEEGLEMVRSVRSMKSRYELDKTTQPTLLVATK